MTEHLVGGIAVEHTLYYFDKLYDYIIPENCRNHAKVGCRVMVNFGGSLRQGVIMELHEAEDFEEIGAVIRGAKAYFLQSFTDRDTVPCGGLHAPSRQELEIYAGIVSKYVEKVSIRGVD